MFRIPHSAFRTPHSAIVGWGRSIRFVAGKKDPGHFYGRVRDSHHLPNTRRSDERTRWQVSWLTAVIPSPFPSSVLDSGWQGLEGPDRSQWRVRAGFSPASLFVPLGTPPSHYVRRNASIPSTLSQGSIEHGDRAAAFPRRNHGFWLRDPL